MGLLNRLFCNHLWKTHAKKEYKWESKIDGTWDRIEIVSETKEILICDKCGKIHKLSY